jgi:uncharacterized protein
MHQLPSPHDSASKTFKVLSIDGGGIKGLYSARILEHFEDKFNCRIADYFDLICGTSTGGLIALGLSLNIPVEKISDLYYRRGKKIFPQQYGRLRSLKQFFLGSKYSNKELRQALEEIFEEKTFADSKCLLCIPSFSLTDGKAFIFKYDHQEGSLCRDNKTKYVEVALATSAAPTYLPIVTINNYGNKQFVDGGVCANNPTLVGVLEALRYFVGNGKDFQRLMVMSIGSLEPSPGRKILTKHNRSITNWNKDLIAIFSEGQASLTDYSVECLSKYCNYPFDYIRIPGSPLSPQQAKVINMDNASNESLDLISQKGSDQGILFGKQAEVREFFKQHKQYIMR